jgi:hypothetical protein
MFRQTAMVGGTVLVLSHAWLLGNQAWDGSLAQPGLLGRWVVAGALTAGLVALWRAGARLRGRHAVALWLLLATVHGPALVDRIEGASDRAVPTASVLIELVAAATLSLTALSALSWRTRAVSSPPLAARRSRSVIDRPATGFALAITARPPPRA